MHFHKNVPNLSENRENNFPFSHQQIRFFDIFLQEKNFAEFFQKRLSTSMCDFQNVKKLFARFFVKLFFAVFRNFLVRHLWGFYHKKTNVIWKDITFFF